MKIKIIGVGKIKQKAILELLNDYLKQMKDVSIVEINDEKDSLGMDKEGENILSKISLDEYVIALAIEGEMMSSEVFASTLDKIVTFQSPNVCFIIGGSWGLSSKVKKRANLLVSFSKMTFPHQLMRLILVEQIYRAKAILRKHPYHK